MAEALKNSIAFVGIDIGKTRFTSLSAPQSCCGRSGPVARWAHGSRIWRYV
ncbi:hypothetical protein M2175_003940 [Bradyrhizobium elkanii]|nr:hypothetical protein [Bradyrhizobium elkanii]MCS3969464.1 hypothetical protein [Bradyrhizobium japonicum]